MQNNWFRKTIQCISLGLFLYLLWLSTFPLVQWYLPVDSFLRLDPLVAVLVPVAVKAYIPNLLAGLATLGIAIFMGRIFCGYICPMGISLDASRAIVPENALTNITMPKGLRKVKYLILFIISFSALFGVSHVFWGSPIALITRFYALLIHPILLFMGKLSLDGTRPLIEHLNDPILSYLQIMPRVFNSVYFLAIFFGALFVLERIRPRFWCRYLCPAGAMLGFLSLKPLWRRRVHVCIDCGKCIKNCPTGAICNNPIKTNHAECITCQSCVKVCPVQGVYFSCFEKKSPKIRPNLPELRGTQPKDKITSSLSNSIPAYGKESPFMPTRRSFLCAAGAGIGLAGLGYISAASQLPAGTKGTIAQSTCIRPPGARPEVDFIAHCIRCGQCMKACPTNGLQPTWFAAGFEGVFSPILVSRKGPCEPECNVCGKVCPTGAIMQLALEEKQQAKVGTAVVRPDICLAWAEGRSCVVCQEVCPFGAVSLQAHASSKVPVPVVNAKRCFGCGFCEKHCPVHIPAIEVYPLNSLRLNDTNYKAAAKSAGFDLVPVAKRSNAHGISDNIPAGELPPGFTK